jgi:hypothetical protein
VGAGKAQGRASVDGAPAAIEVEGDGAIGVASDESGRAGKANTSGVQDKEHFLTSVEVFA